jgi:4-carboxymuconolactone decarboxylase
LPRSTPLLQRLRTPRRRASGSPVSLEDANGSLAAAGVDGTRPTENPTGVDGSEQRFSDARDYHQVMTAADLDVLVASDQLLEAVYRKPRLLDRRTKELLFILSLTVMRAPKEHIRSHIQAALDLGVQPSEVLQAIEIALPEAGVVAFQWGVEAWAEVVEPPLLEPSPEALAVNRAR